MIGVSQFLSHVSNPTTRPGLVLRKGELIIYLAIILKVFYVVCYVTTIRTLCSGAACSASAIIPSLIMAFAQLLIMFGAAQSLRTLGYSSAHPTIIPDQKPSLTPPTESP